MTEYIVNSEEECLFYRHDELIRCKDCKWYGDGYLCYNTETLGMQPDDYCNRAEKEEE